MAAVGVAKPAAAHTGLVRLLDIDRDLGRRLDARTESVARRLIAADVLAVPRGSWRPEPSLDPANGRIALLLFDGFLLRRAALVGRTGAELLGAGDYVNPWRERREDGTIAYEESWKAITPVQGAVIDEQLLATAAGCPGLVAELLTRAMRPTPALALQRAASQLTHLRARLLLLLWYVADRWGTRDTTGAVIPVRLSHDQLGQRVGASRPRVTTAIGRLEKSGLLMRRMDGRWTMRGEPLAELSRMQTGPTIYAPLLKVAEAARAPEDLQAALHRAELSPA